MINMVEKEKNNIQKQREFQWGLGPSSGGGGSRGLRGEVCCDDDSRIVITCSFMPSQGVKNLNSFFAHISVIYI